MNNDTKVDLLQIKIEEAKRKLPLETANAIDSVDWRASIIGLRSKYGYTFEQLGDLELETELLLSGLVTPEDYPIELEKRMRIGGASLNKLINEMNILVFQRVREELIKSIERKKNYKNIPSEGKIETVEKNNLLPEIMPTNTSLDTNVSIQKKIEKTEPAKPSVPPIAETKVQSILTQKLSGYMQIPIVKTEHSLENLTKTTPLASYPPKADPYRLSPDE